jgi:hypothetical protein
VDPDPVVRPVPEAQANEALDAAANAARVSGGTWNLPGREIPMVAAVAQEQNVRAIESALRESAAKKPRWPALVLSISSPLVLAAKGLQDIEHSIVQSSAGGMPAAYEISWGGLKIGLACLVIGIGTAAALAMQWAFDRKKSELQELAKKHVCDWLAEMGKKPRDD